MNLIENTRKTKTDAELETILDTYYNQAESPFRQAAVEEKHKRIKEQNIHNEIVQKDIRKMIRIILWLTFISIIIGIVAILCKPQYSRNSKKDCSLQA